MTTAYLLVWVCGGRSVVLVLSLLEFVRVADRLGLGFLGLFFLLFSFGSLMYPLFFLLFSCSSDGGRLLATMVVGEDGKALLAQFYQKHGCIAISDVSRQEKNRTLDCTFVSAAVADASPSRHRMSFGAEGGVENERERKKKERAAPTRVGAVGSPRAGFAHKNNAFYPLWKPTARRLLAAAVTTACCWRVRIAIHTLHITPVCLCLCPATAPSPPPHYSLPPPPRGLHRGFVRLRIAQPRGSNKAGSGGVQCMAGSQTAGGGLVFLGRSGVSALQVF